MMHGSKKPGYPDQAGFTLLEVLVAVTLVAVMAVGLWAVFRISIQSWSRGTEFMDNNQRHRSILNLVRKQLASASGVLIPPQPPTGTLPPGAYAVGRGLLVFDGTENSLQFLSLNSLHFQESPGLTLVSYEVDQDESGNYSLVEREARYLGQMPGEGSPEFGSRAIPIFENLTSCVFEYYDPGDAVNPSQWVPEWDGQDLGRLPLAVSMTMVSRDPGGNIQNRHMVVPIKAEPFDQRLGMINPFGARAVVQ